MNNLEYELELLKGGELIILFDDIDTKMGVLVGTAEHVKPDKVNLMTKLAKGIISVCLPDEKAKELDLPLMVNNLVNDSAKPFTISVDHKSCTTGISAFERSATIKALSDKNTLPGDFRRPGHIFPLIAKKNGVLDRIDLIEAVFDLVKVTSTAPIGYICEILNKEGRIASETEVKRIAHDYSFPIVKLSEVVHFRSKDRICSFAGQVVKGNQLGRKIGFPTANLYVNEERLHLDHGVYGVKVYYHDREYVGIMNVGVRPTINKEGFNLIQYEVHILDFNEMIYDELLKVEVCFFVREEVSFPNIEYLTTQIKKDIDVVKMRWNRFNRNGIKDTHDLIGEAR